MRGTHRVLLAGVAALGLALVQLPPPVMAQVAAMPSDFNGDGYADLAIAADNETVGSKVGAGAVNVLYGSRAGLTASGDQRWSQDSPGVKGACRSKPNNPESFGHALASGDFDRDGYADLAIGVPGDRVGDVHDAGAINVLYGSKRGLTAVGDQLWSRGNLPGEPRRHERFGGDLASGDFDGDGYWDLAIDAGLVLRGGPDGLTATGVVIVPGGGAAGDLNGDGYADLATVVSGPAAGGNVGVYFGTPDGLTTEGSQLWNQASPGIEDDVDPNDWFGAALAIGDFDADGFGDLAIGVPLESLGPSGIAGRVSVLYGTPDGPTADRAQNWHRDVPGMPPAYRQFGNALATGDFDGDGYGDLAIGVPGDRVEGARIAGSVVVLYGGPSGLGLPGVQLWSQATTGVPGTREKGDQFGAVLAVADYGRSARDDLAIGVPGEEVGRAEYAGMVNVLYGRSIGLSSNHAQGWSQNTPGVKGTAEAFDFFGVSLTP